METKFTKGEWKFKPEKGRWLSHLSSSDGKMVCLFKEEPLKSNMSLIEQSPAMYEMLKNIKVLCEWGYSDQELIELIVTEKLPELIDLLAKCRGEI